MNGIDIHAHLCFPKTYENVDNIIEQMRKEIKGVIASSARYSESVDVVKLAEKHKDVFLTLGHHPIEGDEVDKTKELILENRHNLVAVGEIGLDYHWEKDVKKQEQQKEVFHDFLNLAKRIDKPVVIHSWDAEQDCFDIAKEYDIPLIFHCYSGPVDLAKEIIAAGHYISISTNICFSKKLKKVAKALPVEKILLETDSPFLDPDRERKKNVPWMIKLSAEKIAVVKEMKTDQILEQTTKNAIKIFGLKFT